MFKLRIFVTSWLFVAAVGAVGAVGCGGGPGGKVPASTPIWNFQPPEAEDVFADDDFANDVDEPEVPAAGGGAEGDAGAQSDAQ